MTWQEEALQTASEVEAAKDALLTHLFDADAVITPLFIAAHQAMKNHQKALLKIGRQTHSEEFHREQAKECERDVGSFLATLSNYRHRHSQELSK